MQTICEKNEIKKLKKARTCILQIWQEQGTAKGSCSLSLTVNAGKIPLTPKLMLMEEVLRELGLGGGDWGNGLLTIVHIHCTTACSLGWPRQNDKMIEANTAPTGKKTDPTIVKKRQKACFQYQLAVVNTLNICKTKYQLWLESKVVIILDMNANKHCILHTWY